MTFHCLVVADDESGIFRGSSVKAGVRHAFLAPTISSLYLFLLHYYSQMSSTLCGSLGLSHFI
ncbi:hypothetical protein SISSUDRAFT_1052000 [Sistotremastrum suecicum HHB10207 ss-3]|uniref:Uncharacterized protein n=1 Tax=Sistotremastrum suecicum HHB10207 ss-3 TaxID=1314776 RepID=A0A166A6G2_9AGAM|nr:hypothetical protein SISSUDRAFT_1052000 [Sistotremastrum suecicum HHB10207 ss-3]